MGENCGEEDTNAGAGGGGGGPWGLLIMLSRRGILGSLTFCRKLKMLNCSD